MSYYLNEWRTILIRSAILAASFFVVSHITLSLFLDDDLYLRTLLCDLIHPMAAGLATCFLAFAAAKTAGKTRMAWGLMAAALFSITLAEIVWCLLEISNGTQPFPSLADMFYLMFYPLFAIGILLIPVASQSPGERITRLLDTGIVMIVACLIVWTFLISPNIDASNIDMMTLALSLIYPVADLLLFFVLLQVIFQSVPGAIQKNLMVLAASGAVIIIADCGFSIKFLQGTFVTGGIVDAAYVVSYALVGLAGLMQVQTSDLPPETSCSMEKAKCSSI